MPYAAINGQNIHYTDSGGDKPALLFPHGLLMDCSMFDAQVSAFSNAYRCIAWDERGHGGGIHLGAPTPHRLPAP